VNAAAAQSLPSLYTVLASDEVDYLLQPHQVINYVIDVHPTSGNILVGGLAQYGEHTIHSFLYYMNSSNDSVEWSISLPFINMGVLGVKFSGEMAMLLQYNADPR
jgi:hypothetical protein